MKIKLKELNPNPFKKEINKGHLDKEQIIRIKSNIKELGLMGSIPVFKKENKYFLIAGHHRVQALKEVYGNNFEVEIVIHNYNEEQILRGMIIENLTQRNNDFREINENLVLIRNYLKRDLACSNNEQAKRKDIKGVQDLGSIRHVASWLNKNGEVMSIGEISNHLKIYDNLDKELYDKIEKTHKGNADKRTDGETISFVQAEMISRFKDKKEQKIISKVLLNSREQRVRNQGKLLTMYKESNEEVKKALRDGKIDLEDIPTEKFKSEMGHVNLDREKIYLEHHIDLRQNLSKVFSEKMFLKNSPSSELEITYHYLLNWIRHDLIPFMREVEKEYKLKMEGKKENIKFYDLTERGKN